MKKSNLKKNYDEAPCLPLSLLDKLIDHSPEKKLEPILSPIQRLQLFYEGLQRDLENLLNTRLCYFVNDENLTQLKTSLYSYGMPNFVNNHLEDKEGLVKFCNALTAYIKRFEPRFKTVNVLPILDHQNRQSLQLRIQGTLHGEFLTHEVVFNSFLEDQTQAFTLEKST